MDSAVFWFYAGVFGVVTLVACGLAWVLERMGAR